MYYRDDSDPTIGTGETPQIINLGPVFNQVAAHEFRDHIHTFCHEHPHRCRDIEILSDYDQAECWIKEGGLSGFVITKEGELSNLFSRLVGHGSDALKFAQEKYDRLHLNCFDKLEGFYRRHGFEVLKREKNWHDTPERTLPAVLYMGWEKK